MPITTEDAPKVLPAHGQEIYVAAFNSSYADTCKDRSDRDACASKIAWSAVKKKYKKVGDKWVGKAAHVEVELVITKASLQSDGTMRWQGVASDTSQDLARDRTTVALFRDWVERIEHGVETDFLPQPREPFLGVSHYPSLGGYGEAGTTDRLYVDGNRFKVGGQFADTAIGRALFEAVRAELDTIKRGEVPTNPIRISAAWWDIQHAHGDFKFTRKSLRDRCPMCEEGLERSFLKGQLDHFASTRVPMNPRTSLELEEKSMPKTTRRDDAASIIPEDLADELEERARDELVGKSEAGAETGDALVIKTDDADTESVEKYVTEVVVHEEWRPYGGATSLADAASFMEAQELEWKVHDNWSMLRAVMDNILDNDEEDFDKLGAVRQAVDEFGDRVAALKANISDTYLFQPAIVKGATTMPEETQTSVEEPIAAPAVEPQELQSPGQAFWASIETAAADPTLTREQMVAEAQAGIEALATAAKNQIDAVRPPNVAEEMKAMLDAAIDAKIGPLAEKIELLLAKAQTPITAPALAVPQQKSVTVPVQQMTAPVQRSALDQYIRRSVGIRD
jgi:cation transport regulator